MAEEMERTGFEYTYTYDQFTVFFYGDRVFIGKKDYPIGQCCVDILSLDEALLTRSTRGSTILSWQPEISSQKKQTAPQLSRRRD